MSLLPAADLSSLAWAVMLLAVDYVAVLACILIDCRSGAMRARREGIPRTSSGYRRTVEKASRYFITLIALTVIDLLALAAVMLLGLVSSALIIMVNAASSSEIKKELNGLRNQQEKKTPQQKKQNMEL